MKPVRFGIVSTAKIARDWVIPAMKAVPECEVVAISSRDLSRAVNVAAEFGIPKPYKFLSEMLQDKDIDAVYIPTPNSEHVDDAIDAAKAVTQVLCEKPLGLNATEAQRMAKVKADTGVEI